MESISPSDDCLLSILTNLFPMQPYGFLMFSGGRRLSMWQLETQLFASPFCHWCTFSKRVTARWWRQWAKNQVSTNQNSRNRWCQIVRQTIWYRKNALGTNELRTVNFSSWCCSVLVWCYNFPVTDLSI